MPESILTYAYSMAVAGANLALRAAKIKRRKRFEKTLDR
jgi:hypothetical protein